MAEPKIAILQGRRNSSVFCSSAPLRIPQSACRWWKRSGTRPGGGNAVRHLSQWKIYELPGRLGQLRLGDLGGYFVFHRTAAAAATATTAPCTIVTTVGVSWNLVHARWRTIGPKT